MSGDKRASAYVISAPIFHNNAMGLINDQKSVKNVIVEAVNAEKQLWQLIHSKGPMNTDVQELYRKVRSSYEEIIVNDHELAELQDIEYSLWKLHYKHIDEFRNRIREASVKRKGVNLESETLLEGLKSFVLEATDFYQDLIAKIRRSYGLPKDVSVSNGVGVCRSIESADMGRCQFSCHRSLVFLGDLARYKQLYGNPDTQGRKWSTAARHYLNASLIWPDSGNPQNQLAVLATYLGDEFLALYHCTRSLAVKEPFPDAWNNLILLFEKNRSATSYGLSDKAIFDFSKPSKKSTIQNTTADDVMTEQFGIWPLMVRMMGFFYVKSSLEEFPGIFGSSISQLEILFSLDDVNVKTFLESYQLLDGARKGPFRGLQLVCVLIFTVQTLLESSKSQKSSHVKYKLQPALFQRALASAYIIMGRIVERCVMGNPLDHSYLLPSILVFVEWLVEFLDKPESNVADEIRINAASYFFGVFVNFLNQLENMGCEVKSYDFTALWEDHELRGFLPVSQSHECLDFSTDRESRREYGDNHECEVRISRILLASMKIVNKSSGSQSLIFYEKMGRKFYAAEAMELQCKRDLEAIEGVSDSKGRDLLHNSPQNVQSTCEPTKESEVKSKETIKYNLDVDRISTHVEEEEVILFKPIVRYNSAPLQNLLATAEKVSSSGEPLQRNSSLIFRRQKDGDPSGFRPNLGGSRLKKISWQEPLTESYTITDPVIEELVDSSRFGMAGDEIVAVSSMAGPPSLSGWVLERESFVVSGEKGKFDPSKYDLGKNDCIASAGVSSLSLGEAAIRDQDAKVTSSYASPHFVCRFSSEGDTAVNGLSSFATTPYSAPPFLPQQPSAPLLPDDALWSSSDSSSYSEYKDSEEMKEQFFEASRVNKYSNFPGVQNCAPTFDPLTIPRFNYEDSTSRFHHYQGNFGQAQASNEPVQRNPPSNFGRFQDEDLSRSSFFDRWTNGLTFDQKEKLRDPQWNPGFQKVYGNSDEHEREKLFHAQQSPNPYWGGASMKLKSEQQLLLQYLKEKELRLQLESQLRAIQR
ncbi:hypothetical protein MKW98_024640 [Papaver atlanticum]|uniref:Protein SMG7L-like n=1 Tax=Papaver atlanticum TaxID=357466 RepID=A0AAD4S1Z6_9MAGN|nr:hypothetical protein MKW98_024640 [Papaver atlanticum]